MESDLGASTVTPAVTSGSAPMAVSTASPTAAAPPPDLAQTERDYLWNRRQAVKLRALSNRLYQLERQRIMERREGIVKVASLAASSVAVTKIAIAEVVAGAAAVIFICNCGSLVFGWGNKARDSSKRATEWIALEADIDRVGERDFEEDQVNAWEARCGSIEAGEPAQNEALFERCYQKACEALGRTPKPGGPRTVWRLFRLIP